MMHGAPGHDVLRKGDTVQNLVVRRRKKVLLGCARKKLNEWLRLPSEVFLMLVRLRGAEVGRTRHMSG